MADETLVYDTETNTAFCLNAPATIVMNRCDGSSTVAAVLAEIRAKLGSDLDDHLIWSTVEDLRRHKMLADTHTDAFVVQTVSRRTMLRHAAALGVAVPIISALVVPPALHAASTCLSVNQNCVIGTPPLCCPTLACLPNVNEGHSCFAIVAATIPLDPNAPPPKVTANGTRQ